MATSHHEHIQALARCHFALLEARRGEQLNYARADGLHIFGMARLLQRANFDLTRSGAPVAVRLAGMMQVVVAICSGTVWQFVVWSMVLMESTSRQVETSRAQLVS